jgi:hypothetical protein
MPRIFPRRAAGVHADCRLCSEDGDKLVLRTPTGADKPVVRMPTNEQMVQLLEVLHAGQCYLARAHAH